MSVRPGAPPRVLTIAGSDSGGGAGIQADLKTMLALGVHGMSAVTAVTAQNSVGVQGVWELPAEAVRAQVASVVDDIGVDAVKTGMLASEALVRATVAALAGVSAPLVVDPVCVTTHGHPLLTDAAVEAMVAELLPRATVLTPNLHEVHRLTGVQVRAEADLDAAATALLALGPRWVLVKGGHLDGAEAVDLLSDGSTRLLLRAPRVRTGNTHGTGCTLASAVAAHLAHGDDVPTAVTRAKAYLTGAVRGSFPLGAGHGPVRHGWAWHDRADPTPLTTEET